jgi:glucokinase
MIKWYLIKEIRKIEPPVLSIDIGGTKIAMALVNGRGDIIARKTRPTLASRGPEAVIENLSSGIEDFLSESEIRPEGLNAISMAVAGVIDMKRGLITVSPNLPGWNNIPLRKIIYDKFKITTFLLNDADAAALGEYFYGAGQGLNTIIVLTLGTGIGGGIIINGKLYFGHSVSAAEIGHMVIDTNGPKCACGNRGCLEALASGTAVAREAISRIRRGGQSSLVEIAGGKPENITAEMVHRAAKEGDSLACEVIDRAAYYLGIGVVNLLNIFNPEMVIFGGSMAQMGDLLLQPVRQIISEKAYPHMVKSTSIVQARLGNDAGILGAAVYAMEQ